ncbi:hypothetical protein [Kocuria sp.]|uniref:hypothetical protein n=1 Tax=Kocuria sp. TaxID=1871328 RepID=UPI0026E0D42D|nr:hypothetical protein [Kocuria sp.]MDO5619080.1 hypothetical protein [Kocuria sp.]
MIKGEPTWFGTGSSAVLGWVHTPPEATSRGIVVVAAPAGRELLLSTLTVRGLCIVLAQAGFTAVRFGWRGSLDSQPLRSQDNAVAAWQEDLRTVVATTQEMLGAHDLPVHAVGYRTGAAVVGTMLEEFQTVVSWEPVAGKTFVRQWSRLRHTVAAHVPDTAGLVDLLGMALTPEQAEQFSQLGTPEPTTAATVSPSTAPQAEGEVPATTVVEIKETDKRRAKAMFGVEPFDVRLHHDVFDRVRDALPADMPRAVVGELPTVLQNSWTENGGVVLHERLVEVGRDHRVGVVTWREGDGQPGAFAGVQGLFVSGGGPDGRYGGGEWPLIARDLALDGVVTLRVDRPLVGDSTPVDAVRATNSYTRRSAVSFVESVDWLKASGCQPVSAALLCSSAWAASLGEIQATPTGASCVVLIGHSEWKMSEDLWADVRETYNADAARDAPASTNRAARSAPAPAVPQRSIRKGPVGILDRVRWARDVVQAGGFGLLKSMLRDQTVLAVRTWMPYPLWKLAGRRALMETPERVLEPMSSRARVVVLNGPDDLPRWKATRADRAVERLAEAGLPIRSIESDRLDHSVITATGCRTVLDTLRTELLGSGNRPASGSSDS